MAGRSPAFQAAWDKSLTLAAQPTNDEKLDVRVPSPSLPPLPLVPSHPTAKLFQDGKEVSQADEKRVCSRCTPTARSRTRSSSARRRNPAYSTSRYVARLIHSLPPPSSCPPAFLILREPHWGPLLSFSRANMPNPASRPSICN